MREIDLSVKSDITAETGKDYDRIIATADLDSTCTLRRTAVTFFMKINQTAVVIIIDNEDHRDPNLRYLTGHPSDAVFILSSNGDNVLIPWDENLADKMAHVGQIIPLTSFGRDNVTAIKETLKKMDLKSGSQVELPPSPTYPKFLKFVEELSEFDLRCRENSVHSFIDNQRMIKDDYEIACTRKACAINSEMTDEIENLLKKGKIRTETDVALYIEKTLRSFGCERTGFDTLAAGPERSFAIHAFPGYTGGNWGSKGLSILDYGVVVNGYTSDCTITIANSPSREQEKLLTLVEEAFDACLPLYAPEKQIKSAALKADSVFAKAKRKMPHGLGHGIGLEIHENPFVNVRAAEEKKFLPGMTITLEPGLYDPVLGGVRLENDVLILSKGNEVLTNSRIIRI